MILTIVSGNYFVNQVQSAELVQVTGKLIYPSDYLPSMIVCAVSINEQKRLCIKTIEGQSTFSMKVPPDTYMFSAETPDNNNMKAWMTSFHLNCGEPCQDNPIHVLKVKVDKNNVREICPCDWYTKPEMLIFPEQN